MPIFKVGDIVRDLRFPGRPGGTVTEVCKTHILVDMEFENGTTGFCQFKIETAQKELKVAT